MQAGANNEPARPARGLDRSVVRRNFRNIVLGLRVVRQIALDRRLQIGVYPPEDVALAYAAAQAPHAVAPLLVATAGAAGLTPTLRALEAGRPVAIANKEVLVMAGHLVREAMLRGGGDLRPVDSEHSAIWQCLWGEEGHAIRRIILTASGGAFRDLSPAELDAVTPEQALNHPTWNMGRKITVDSATLANKALEVIEAHFLFGIDYDRIDVVVHPQSVVHSFVEFIDGSVLAQLGVPSMELPVLYALTHPERIGDTGVPPFDPVELSPLTFEPVRGTDFPALRLGIEAGRKAGAAPAVFNAANEQAVALFLEGRVSFGDIPRAIASALDRLGDAAGATQEELLTADREARRHVRELLT